jgi:hypothetical protein
MKPNPLLSRADQLKILQDNEKPTFEANGIL